MKKFKERNVIMIIYGLLAIGGAITFFIVYKNIDSKIAFKFVVGYVLFLFLSVSYMIGKSMYNLRKLKWLDVKKRLIRFMVLGLSLSTLNYFVDYIFRHERVDLTNNILIAFGVAFGTVFLDLVFLSQNSIEADVDK